MPFDKNEWVDQNSEYPQRRKLTDVSTGAETLVDVERAEGNIATPGDRFDSEHMNDLEQRIYDAIQTGDNNTSNAQDTANGALELANENKTNLGNLTDEVHALDAAVVKSVNGVLPTNNNVAISGANIGTGTPSIPATPSEPTASDFINQAIGKLIATDRSISERVKTIEDADYWPGTAESAFGLKSKQLGTEGTPTDLNQLYGLEHDALFWAGSGNAITNKPSGVDSFGVFVQRVSEGHTIQVLYAAGFTGYSGLFSREWNGTSWGAWKNPIGDIEGILTPVKVTNLNQNPNSWGFPGGLTGIQSYKIYFDTTITGAPVGWGATAGSGIWGRQTTIGDGIVLITRDNSTTTGNTVEVAYKLWNENGSYWTPWRVFGSQLGSASNYFNAVYTQLIKSSPSNAINVSSGITTSGANTHLFSDGIGNILALQRNALYAASNVGANVFDIGISDRPMGTGYFANLVVARLSTPTGGGLLTTSTIRPTVDNSLGLGSINWRWNNVHSTAFTLNGDTITEWPTGGGSDWGDYEYSNNPTTAILGNTSPIVNAIGYVYFAKCARFVEAHFGFTNGLTFYGVSSDINTDTSNNTTLLLTNTSTTYNNTEWVAASPRTMQFPPLTVKVRHELDTKQFTGTLIITARTSDTANVNATIFDAFIELHSGQGIFPKGAEFVVTTGTGSSNNTMLTWVSKY